MLGLKLNHLVKGATGARCIAKGSQNQCFQYPIPVARTPKDPRSIDNVGLYEVA